MVTGVREYTDPHYLPNYKKSNLNQPKVQLKDQKTIIGKMMNHKTFKIKIQVFTNIYKI
jgi:hypothetical protein